MSVTSIALHNGQKIPQLGFGVWQAAEGECYHAVRAALEVGYRHLDDLLAASAVKPVVNQVELHPWLSQQELKQHCESRGIRIEA